MRKVKLDIVEALQALKDGEIVCGCDPDGGAFCVKADKKGYLEIQYVDDFKEADFKNAEYADSLDAIIPPLEIYSLKQKVLWKYVEKK